ncbi:MAG: hypothetical protein GY853_00685 [PVC group bacterium]|nr:hypothetical protein [PVC group bacterium]
MEIYTIKYYSNITRRIIEYNYKSLDKAFTAIKNILNDEGEVNISKKTIEFVGD